jgi:hypothetical protein
MPKDGPAGGCQCGAVRYVLEAKRHPVYACHCRECQKQSAAAFGLSMPVRADDIEVTGELAFYERATDSGSRTRCAFCPQCGTRLYHRSARYPDILTLKAGSLDDTSGLAPAAHIWTSRRQPWVILDDGVPAFETQPEDLKAWRLGLLEAAQGKG